MNLLGKVRRLHYRDGLSLSEIERRTGLTRKTIRKWLKAPEGIEPGYRRKRGDTKWRRTPIGWSRCWKPMRGDRCGIGARR